MLSVPLVCKGCFNTPNTDNADNISIPYYVPQLLIILTNITECVYIYYLYIIDDDLFCEHITVLKEIF